MMVLMTWDHQGMVRDRCESWLTDKLLPMVLEAMGQPPAPAADLAAGLRLHPDVKKLQDEARRLHEGGSLSLSSFASRAVDVIDELRVVAIAVMVAHWAGETRASVDARDAIAFAAFLAAAEQAYADDRLADVPPDHGIDPSRAMAADDVLERWRDLAEPAARALLDLVVELAADMPVPTNPYG